MKKVLLSLATLLLLILTGGTAYFYLHLNSLVKKAVETYGPPLTGTEVRLSSANLSPFSGSGALNGLLIGNPRGFNGSFALKVGSISVQVDKATLTKDPIVINSVTVNSPEVMLVGTLSGTNLQKLLSNIRAAGSPSKRQEPKPVSSGASRKFLIREVVISGTRLHLAVSALGRNVEQSIPLPEIRRRNLGSGGRGVSASDAATQIIAPLLDEALKQGLRLLTPQGILQLPKSGAQELDNQLNKVLPGFFK